MTRRIIAFRTFLTTLVCLIVCWPLLICLSGCQLTPTTTAPVTAQPLTTTAPPETQPTPEFTLDSMCAIIDNVHEFYYSQETFTLPITPYTKWYADRAINRYDAQIEYAGEYIRFARDDPNERCLIYLLFLNTLLTEYGDQVCWVTRGRDVSPYEPMAFYELNVLSFFPECQKAGYESVEAYEASWPHAKNDTPYVRFRISINSMSVVAEVNGRTYSCFHISNVEGEAPYYDGTWEEWE